MRIGIVNFSTALGTHELRCLKHYFLFAKVQPTILFIKKDSLVDKEISQRLCLKLKLKIEKFEFQKLWNPLFILLLRQKIIEHKIEVLLFFDLQEAKILSLAVKGLPVKLVLREDMLKKGNSYDWLNQFIMSRIDAIIPSSQYAASNLQSQLSHIKKNYVPGMIYNSFDTNHPSIHQSVDDKNRYLQTKNNLLELLQIGNIEEDNGHFETLKAIKHLKKCNILFKLTFVGEVTDISYHQKILHYIKENELVANVVFVGPHQDLSYFFKKSHVMLAPLHKSDNDQRYLDALSHGMTLITFENSSLMELKLLGFKIFLISDKDQNIYNKKLEDIAINSQIILRDSLDVNLHLTLQYFSSDVITKQWLTFFRDLLDDRKNCLRNSLNFKVS